MKTHYIRNPIIQAQQQQQQQQHYKRPTKLDLNRLAKFIKPIIMAFEEFLNSLQQEGGGDVLTKVGVFLLVQALVYLILTKSSNIFSSCRSSSSSSSMLRSLSFRPARMSSVHRVLDSLSDFPAGSDDPSSANPTD